MGLEGKVSHSNRVSRYTCVPPTELHPRLLGRHQKATLAELLTLAIFLLLQGQDLAKGYLAAKTTLKAYFPSLPHFSRFYRVLQ